MRIVQPNEILGKSRMIHGGFIFTAKDGAEITMASGEFQGDPLTNLNIPDLPYLDVEIYILPYVYRQRANGMWTENAMPARAGVGWIALSPKKPQWASLNYTYIVWHELGHQFHYQLLNFVQTDKKASPEFKEYMKLRGLRGWKWGSRVYSHSKRAEEVFADDFAHIVGGIPLETLSYLQYAGKPDDKVRDYILSFIPNKEGGE